MPSARSYRQRFARAMNGYEGRGVLDGNGQRLTTVAGTPSALIEAGWPIQSPRLLRTNAYDGAYLLRPIPSAADRVRQVVAGGLNSAEGRQGPENVRRDPRVTVTVVNHDNPYEYAQIRGKVVEDTHEGADENIDKLAKKYLDKDEYPFRQPGEQRVMFRIEPERVKLHGG